MLRTFGAVLAGYVVMAVIVMITSIAWIAAREPGGVAAMRARIKGGGGGQPVKLPGGAYLVFNIAMSLMAAYVGGTITSMIAATGTPQPLIYLSGVVVMMGVISARAPQSAGQPKAYALAIPLVGFIGVLLSWYTR